MIRTPTVLVLGAGASADFGFPTGRKLLLDICRGTLADGPLFQFLTEEMKFANVEVLAFREALLNSQAPSVDLFLAHRPEYRDLGKAAIAASLLPYESFGAFTRTETTRWYEFLFSLMIEGGGDFGENELRVITFNYDRSLEAFFWFALCYLRGLKKEAALEESRKIPVHHMYGDLGPDIWKPALRSGYRYGLAAEAQTLAPAWVSEAAARIRLMPEGEDATQEGRAAEFLTWAEEVIFLGFAFHEENVNYLWLDNTLQRRRSKGREPFRSFASRYGMGDGDIVRAMDTLPVQMRGWISETGKWATNPYEVGFGDDFNAKITEFLKATPCLRSL
jgi:hypothetical protein